MKFSRVNIVKLNVAIMKNLQGLFIGMLLLASQVSMAQFEKGNWQIGGTAGLDLEFVDGSDNPLTIMLNPTIATFITDRVAVGANLGLVYLTSGDFSTTVLNLLPLARYYVPDASGKAAFFLEAKAGLALVSADIFDGVETETAFQAALGPGVAFLISDCVSIDAILAYNRINGDLDQSSLGLNVGLQVYLTKDKH